jgi:hypothetical protein
MLGYNRLGQVISVCQVRICFVRIGHVMSGYIS